MTPFPPVRVPQPAKLRLVTRDATTRASATSRVKPPCGIAAWSTEHDADIAILLQRPAGHEVPTLDEVAAQLPAPTTLPAGTLVLVLGEVEASAALLGRWLGAKAIAPRALRASALLALGYGRVGGALDAKTGQDLAWGYVRGS